jgi:hypothetical protein
VHLVDLHDVRRLVLDGDEDVGLPHPAGLLVAVGVPGGLGDHVELVGLPPEPLDRGVDRGLEVDDRVGAVVVDPPLAGEGSGLPQDGDFALPAPQVLLGDRVLVHRVLDGPALVELALRQQLAAFVRGLEFVPRLAAADAALPDRDRGEEALRLEHRHVPARPSRFASVSPSSLCFLWWL